MQAWMLLPATRPESLFVHRHIKATSNGASDDRREKSVARADASALLRLRGRLLRGGLRAGGRLLRRTLRGALGLRGGRGLAASSGDSRSALARHLRDLFPD